MVMPDLMAAFESGCRTANGEKNTVCCNDIHIQGFLGMRLNSGRCFLPGIWILHSAA